MHFYCSNSWIMSTKTRTQTYRAFDWICDGQKWRKNPSWLTWYSTHRFIYCRLFCVVMHDIGARHFKMLKHTASQLASESTNGLSHSDEFLHILHFSQNTSYSFILCVYMWTFHREYFERCWFTNHCFAIWDTSERERELFWWPLDSGWPYVRCLLLVAVYLVAPSCGQVHGWVFDFCELVNCATRLFKCAITVSCVNTKTH